MECLFHDEYKEQIVYPSFKNVILKFDDFLNYWLTA